MKLRIMSDTLAHSSSGHSLNDSILLGPCNYMLILNNLLRFRCHRVAMTCTTDVSKMFWDIELNPSEWDYHLFIIHLYAGESIG